MSTLLHVYDRQTGAFVGRSFHLNETDPKTIAAFITANVPEGHGAYQGPVTDWEAQCVDASGALADFQPIQPSPDHEWIDRRWRLNPVAAAALAAHQSALSQILALEAKQPRMIREVALGDEGALARIQELDRQISVLRQQLQK